MNQCLHSLPTSTTAAVALRALVDHKSTTDLQISEGSRTKGGFAAQHRVQQIEETIVNTRLASGKTERVHTIIISIRKNIWTPITRTQVTFTRLSQEPTTDITLLDKMQQTLLASAGL
jgi:hypothetical protein